MAESPESWDLITASLALCDLQSPFEAWAFLVLQGLVRDGPGDRETFAQFVREAVANPITGPTAAARVAFGLNDAGISLPTADVRDPWGEIAAQRLSLIEPWLGRQGAAQHLEYLMKRSKHAESPGSGAPPRDRWTRSWRPWRRS